MRPYAIQLQTSGPVARWARPDSMPNLVSYVASTFPRTKRIFKTALGRKVRKVRLSTGKLNKWTDK